MAEIVVPAIAGVGPLIFNEWFTREPDFGSVVGNDGAF